MFMNSSCSTCDADTQTGSYCRKCGTYRPGSKHDTSPSRQAVDEYMQVYAGRRISRGFLMMKDDMLNDREVGIVEHY